MTKTDKRNHISAQMQACQAQVWKSDSNAKAFAKAGLEPQATAAAKESADAQRLHDAFDEQLKGLGHEDNIAS